MSDFNQLGNITECIAFFLGHFTVAIKTEEESATRSIRGKRSCHATRCGEVCIECTKPDAGKTTL